MTEILRYKWTSFGPMLDEDGPFVLLVDAEAARRDDQKRWETFAHDQFDAGYDAGAKGE